MHLHHSMPFLMRMPHAYAGRLCSRRQMGAATGLDLPRTAIRDTMVRHVVGPPEAASAARLAGAPDEMLEGNA
jgi:hypothetical protein